MGSGHVVSPVRSNSSTEVDLTMGEICRPRPKLLLQVTDSTSARRLRGTKSSVLDFMGNFQTSAACVTTDMATKSVSTIGIALNLNFYFDSPCGVVGVAVRVEGTSLRALR